MKFFKVCAAVLAISGVVYNSAYGMDNQPLTHQGEVRGGADPAEINSQVVGIVQASLTMLLQDSAGIVENATEKVISLYSDGGDITQEGYRTLTFTLKNVGSRYQISILGRDGLTNESCNGHKWAVKASNSDSKIGVNIVLYPAGGDEVSVDNSNPMDFQDNWRSGDWRVVVNPQQLTPDTVIDTYIGKMVVKIEATN